MALLGRAVFHLLLVLILCAVLPIACLQSLVAYGQSSIHKL
jgi:hypothetical protein